MKKWITLAVLVVSIMCFTGIAFAFMIPIYGWSTPVKITKSGSYLLQTNLVINNANTTAILVTADNVTIDLNGFAIIGPNVCSGVPLVCNNNGTGKGIDAGVHQNIKVYNGTIRGMGDLGISTGNGAIIESVRVISNGNNGIGVDSGTVSGNTVTGNGSYGINVNTDGTVSGNTVTGNGGYGIGLGSGTVSGNTVTGNGTNGIFVTTGTVSGNMVTGNGGNGIGLFIVSSGTVIGNTVTYNGGYGLFLGTSTGYVNNVLAGNTSGNVSGGVNLKPNLCGTALCP